MLSADLNFIGGMGRWRWDTVRSLAGSNGRYIYDSHPAIIDLYAEGNLPPYSAETTQCDANGDVRMRDEF